MNRLLVFLKKIKFYITRSRYRILDDFYSHLYIVQHKRGMFGKWSNVTSMDKLGRDNVLNGLAPDASPLDYLKTNISDKIKKENLEFIYKAKIYYDVVYKTNPNEW